MRRRKGYIAGMIAVGIMLGIAWVTIKSSRVAIVEKPLSGETVDIGHGMGLYAITFGQGNFVAVGDGNICSSADGSMWSCTKFPPGEGSGPEHTVFRSITYGDGRFVAVAGRGKIWTSTSLSKWSPVTTGFDRDLWSVAYGDGQFVAVGVHVIMTSKDGSHWATVQMNPVLTHVAYGRGHFVATGSSIMSSADGQDWRTDSNPYFDTVVGSNDKTLLLAGSPLYYSERAQISQSTDGSQWDSMLRYHELITDIGCGGSTCVFATRNHVLSTRDGRHWTASTVPISLGKVAYGHDRFVLLGVDRAFIFRADGL